jgi:branched-chain amino acid aminotransferase
MGELAPVTRVDGRTIGDGVTGPMTQRLSALFRDLAAREGVQVIN